jgi:glutamate racemase
MSADAPIAIIDSGIGGLSVVRALREKLPHERILYFGDTARTPYGWKSAETVTGFVRQIVQYLRGYDPKHILIACNTASALALPAIRKQFSDVAISGVVEPGARAAIEAAGAKAFPLIAIMATEATIWSKAYERAIHRRRHHARLLLRPAPLLVPLIEEGRAEKDPMVRLALRQYLQPLIARGADVLVLGCTHYTQYKSLIAQQTAGKITLIDSAAACAEDVARRLQAANLLSGNPSGGLLRCFVTDGSPRFRTLAAKFLGHEPDPPTLVTPDQLYAIGQDLQQLRISAA